MDKMGKRFLELIEKDLKDATVSIRLCDGTQFDDVRIRDLGGANPKAMQDVLTWNDGSHTTYIDVGSIIFIKVRNAP